MTNSELIPSVCCFGMNIPTFYLYTASLAFIPLCIFLLNFCFQTSTLRKFSFKIPLIAGIALCEWPDFKKALKEFLIKFTLGSMPILISTLVFYIHNSNSDGALTSNFKNGELYLFCGSMLASIYYIASRERSEAESDGYQEKKLLFPSKDVHVLLVFILIFFSGLIYAFRKVGILMPEYLLVEFSYYFFVTVVFLSLLTNTINNALNGGNAIKYLIEATKKFNSDYVPGQGGH